MPCDTAENLRVTAIFDLREGTERPDLLSLDSLKCFHFVLPAVWQISGMERNGSTLGLLACGFITTPPTSFFNGVFGTVFNMLTVTQVCINWYTTIQNVVILKFDFEVLACFYTSKRKSVSAFMVFTEPTLTLYQTSSLDLKGAEQLSV